MPTQEDVGSAEPNNAPVAQPEPQPQIPKLEGQELLRMNAKFFLFDAAAVTWNTRGIGSIILLLDKDKKTVSLVMKSRTAVYANFIIADVKPQLSMGSKETRALLWGVPADSSRICDEQQTLAARFATQDYASRFKSAYEDAQKGIFNQQDGSAGEKPKQSNRPGVGDGRD